MKLMNFPSHEPNDKKNFKIYFVTVSVLFVFNQSWSDTPEANRLNIFLTK